MRRNAKKAAMAIALALAIAAGTAGIAASYAARAPVTGTIGAGRVEIDLVALPGPDSGPLATGGSAECAVRVDNLGADCWVRVRVGHAVSGGAVGEVSWLGGEECPSPGWARAADGWWYLTEPLPAGASAPFASALSLPFFEQVRAGGGWEWEPVRGEPDPAKWSEPSPDPGDDAALRAYSGAEGSRLVETVEAEAVQAAHFEPDFSEARPWGDVEAEAGTEASLGEEEEL